ncbi:MAG TPA: hypothetical protein VGG27_13225 [Magnetospirillaceae bacterium]
MTMVSRNALSCLAIALVVALGVEGVAFAPARAQTAGSTPLDPIEPTEAEMPRLDVQNVQPARLILLSAMQQLSADRQAGDQATIWNDEIAVIEARHGLMEAQMVADQTRMPQAPADVQAILQARDGWLRADEASDSAREKLIQDQQANNAGGVREDIALVNATRQQSTRARQQWLAVQAQLRSVEPPTDPQ